MNPVLITARMLLATVLLGLSLSGRAASPWELVKTPDQPAVSAVKHLFIPASAFRPVLAMTPWEYEEEGGLINPGNNDSDWIAPIQLPEGVTLRSLELVWKNASLAPTNGFCSVSLHLTSTTTGGSLLVYTQMSGEYQPGVQRVMSSFSLTLEEGFYPAAHVYLGDSDRWLMGVRVGYVE